MHWLLRDAAHSLERVTLVQVDFEPLRGKVMGRVLLAGVVALSVWGCERDGTPDDESPAPMSEVTPSKPTSSMVPPTAPSAQPTPPPQPGNQGLTVADLITLKQFGYSESAITQEINRTGVREQVTASEAQRLRDAGFSASFIESLQREAKPLPAEASTRPPQLPKGFERIEPVPGKGTLLLSRVDQAGSATDQIRDLFGQMAEFFDHRPVAGAAVRDKQDLQAQATFTATVGGKPIRGIAMASVHDGWTRVGLAFDQADRAPETIDALALELVDQVRRDAQQTADRIVLREHQFPDRSGTVGLPEGWQIAFASKGAVDITGPQGQSLSLGVASQVLIPKGTVVGPTPGPVGMLLVAPMAKPAEALEAMVPQINSIARQVNRAVPTVRFGKVIEQAPVEFPGGKGAFVHYMVFVDDVPHDALSLIGVSPLTPDSWMFYQSTATAPSRRFTQDLPLMVRIWQTWQIDQRTLDERMEKARDALDEITEIIESSHRFREQVFDNIHTKWSSHFRGEGDLSSLVKSANVANGFDCWELIRADRLD